MTATQASTANILSSFLDGYNNNNVGWCALNEHQQHSAVAGHHEQ